MNLEPKNYFKKIDLFKRIPIHITPNFYLKFLDNFQSDRKAFSNILRIQAIKFFLTV